MKSKSANSLPSPSESMLVLQKQLSDLIRKDIEKQGGKISFARYMELALFTPGLGYYSNSLMKLGRQGDFVTAPELSPLFANTLAEQCYDILKDLNNACIFEFGAGSGMMAAHLLVALEKKQCLPETYYILELSAELRDRQQKTFQQYYPNLLKYVCWLDELPTFSITGIIIANEVLDAMPVHRFQITENDIKEYYVAWNDEAGFVWQMDTPSDERIFSFANELKKELPKNALPYSSEIHLIFPAWLASVNKLLAQGIVLLIDYGFPHHEYYHTDRSMGTLMCHYQHHAHSNPLILTGLQDITAHVDFSALVESARQLNLEICGYTNQAFFLLSCGILELAKTDQDKQAVKTLTLPHEMGELFKVLALGRDFSKPLRGFSMRDWQDKL